MDTAAAPAPAAWGICTVTACAEVQRICAWEAAALRVPEFTAWGGGGGPAYSVCWLESFTPALGFVRVWVPVKAKRKDVTDPPVRGREVLFECPSRLSEVALPLGWRAVV